MIERYVFGHMLPTDSIPEPPRPAAGAVPFLQGGAAGWQYTLAAQDVVYGLGESSRGINKRGWHYISNCTDESTHTEDKVSLYGAHNFFVVSGAETFGVFVDFAGQVRLMAVTCPRTSASSSLRAVTSEANLTTRTTLPDRSRMGL